MSWTIETMEELDTAAGNPVIFAAVLLSENTRAPVAVGATATAPTAAAAGVPFSTLAGVDRLAGGKFVGGVDGPAKPGGIGCCATGI